MDYTTKSCREFVTVLASDAPAPGGGGASALVAALGTALGNMVGSLTVGKKKYADVEAEIVALKAKCDALQTELLDQVPADAEGFVPLAKAYGIPKDDPSRPEIMEKAEKTPLVLDGLYSWSEYKILKEKLGDLLQVWAIVTDASVRRERLAHRPVRPLTAEEVDRRDAAEIENLEKGGPIAAADRFLVNNGPLGELRAQYAALTARL